MIGIELGAPSTRAARVNWRLIHMASEGLFPQLIVIPLHRDHGVITMAAGKNDVIKLLPPLTLSEARGRELPRRRSMPCSPTVEGSGSKNWGVVRDIATVHAAPPRHAAEEVAEAAAAASDSTRLAAPRSTSRARTCASSPARAASSAGAWRGGS